MAEPWAFIYAQQIPCRIPDAVDASGEREERESAADYPNASTLPFDAQLARHDCDIDVHRHHYGPRRTRAERRIGGRRAQANVVLTHNTRYNGIVTSIY